MEFNEEHKKLRVDFDKMIAYLTEEAKKKIFEEIREVPKQFQLLESVFEYITDHQRQENIQKEKVKVNCVRI